LVLFALLFSEVNLNLAPSGLPLREPLALSPLLELRAKLNLQ
jgi:hypothetical protein